MAALPEGPTGNLAPAAGPAAAEAENLALRARSPFWVRFARNRLALIGVGVIAFLYLLALLAPLVTNNTSPDAMNLLHALAPPGPGHPMGTDEYGRDIWTRVVYGGRISLTVGLVSVSTALVIGIVIGGVAGYFGGIVDSLLMRFTDAVLAFPFLFLLLTVVAIIGPSIFNIFLTIGLTTWPGIARFVRADFLSLRERDFIEAARSMGARPRRIIFRHILPNAVAPVIVNATLGVGFAILAEAGLDFIGVGLQPPTASWGTMLNAGQNYMLSGDWWYTVFPGLFIFIAVLSVNVIGDGLLEAFNPRAQRR